jgi:hypothetical protein
MAADRANDLRAFRQFIDKQLGNGGPEMTLDDALISWEAENSSEACLWFRVCIQL